MESFSGDITNELGIVVGCYSGSVCNSTEEVFKALEFITEPDLMEEWENRITGGFRFPCSVLSRIDVWEEFEDCGFGTKGMQQFNDKALSLGAVMGVVRIGWHGDPVEERMAKSLHFYQKTEWVQIERKNEYEFHLAYRTY